MLNAPSGSAKRRRQRRLRSWLRHERQTVALELAAALHHSRDVGPGTHAGPRAQKAASSREVEAHETYSALRGPKQPPPGERPGILLEPLPQRSDRSRRHFSGDTHPTPGLPVLAGASGEVRLLRPRLPHTGCPGGEEEGGEEGGDVGEGGAEGEAGGAPCLGARGDSGARHPSPRERQGFGAPEASGPPQPGPFCSHHCALQEDEEEEEEEEEKHKKGTFLLLLFMTSLTILSSLSSAGVWLPESTGISDLWEMTFSTAPCIWQSLVWRWACQRSTIRGLSGR